MVYVFFHLEHLNSANCKKNIQTPSKDYYKRGNCLSHFLFNLVVISK